ncbi:MAG TPA: 7-carboxy-7-deazaguanine synthase QueE [Planctomycetota bacterium]|jgi:organic radical activating enzyme
MNGHLLEMYSSFQGEGPLAGVRQIFVRFSGCHLRCVYCDTPESWERSAGWRIETAPGSRAFEDRGNPVGTAEVLSILGDWNGRVRHHSVAFTGGEPLLQPEFLRSLALGAKGMGLRTYLDTSGTLGDRLESVADVVDIFALDLKLPSCPGVRLDWEDARRCLAAVRGREAFVKIVVLEDSDPAEVARAARLVRETDPAIRVVLQPVTPVSKATVEPSGRTLAMLRTRCLDEGIEPLVIPQLHKLAGWL